MLPIVYEQHCQACHPLTFERAEGANVDWQAAVVPHRQQPGQIRRFLEVFYLDRLQRSKPNLLQQPFPPLPGKPVQPEQRILAEVVYDRVQRAEQQLYVGKKVCGECHYSKTGPERDLLDPLKDLKIEPTQVPEVWFEKANFTHTPHRLFRLFPACHPEADRGHAEMDAARRAASLFSIVMLPDIENCLNCHSPSSPGGGMPGRIALSAIATMTALIRYLAPGLKFEQGAMRASGQSGNSSTGAGRDFRPELGEIAKPKVAYSRTLGNRQT